ncbi:MAG: metallophosphoesterase [Candidatus Woesearchaeota archaeon]
MKIAIFSDSHDNVKLIEKALEICKQEDIKTILHCGDLVAPATINFFNGFKVYFVRGNCDGDLINIKKNLEAIGGIFLNDFAVIELENRKIAMYHGNNPAILFAAMKLDVDVICYGHTHESKIEKFEQNGKEKLIINPGSFYNSKIKHSFAILDLKNLEAKIIELN